MLRSYSVMAIALITLTALSPNREIKADEPEGVIRQFAVLLSYDAEDTDFTSDDSVLLKVSKSDVSPDIAIFTGFGADLEGIPATSGSPLAMYITKSNGQTQAGSFYWLLTDETPEPPPIGSVSMLGSDACLLQEDLGRVTFSGGYILPNGDVFDQRMILVTARFTK